MKTRFATMAEDA